MSLTAAILGAVQQLAAQGLSGPWVAKLSPPGRARLTEELRAVGGGDVPDGELTLHSGLGPVRVRVDLLLPDGEVYVGVDLQPKPAQPTVRPDEVQLLTEMQKQPTPADPGWPGERPRAIAKGLGIPVKRSDYLFLKWSRKGWYEWGVCIDMGWLTEAGKQARAGDPAVPPPPVVH